MYSNFEIVLERSRKPGNRIAEINAFVFVFRGKIEFDDGQPNSGRRLRMEVRLKFEKKLLRN